MKSGSLFVISGPSGTGKGTICKHLIRRIDAELSVSMTTRIPRAEEVEGVSYFFVTDADFDKEISEGGLLEYANVYGNRYGTPKAPVCAHLKNGKDVILEIDIQGALQVKQNFPEGIFIFILPPSIEELRQRIRGRGSETDASIALRLSEARKEIEFIREYDYYVINDVLEDAVANVEAITRAVKARVDAESLTILEQYR
ncbi:MAG: guanylate kinase [Clostridiales Family XIII bacterium]|jgi:guanylate kinase|nr:guanylate kinase [Clostridiales Family XIII bacterium]